MGCSYGSSFKISQARTWHQLLAWDPDVAFVQECLEPSEWLKSDSYRFTPYPWCAEMAVKVGTLVYARSLPLEAGPDLPYAEMLSGQITAVEAATPGSDRPLLLASVHAMTGAMAPGLLAGHDVAGVGGSHTTKVYPVDLIRHSLSQVTAGRRFVVGGDFNTSIRFDDLYTKGSVYYGNVEWFTRLREAGWRNAHRKFHTGDERTLFRLGKDDEHFQIDHLFTDSTTWGSLARCDVLTVPFLEEFTDHAPLVMEWAA
jgi:exonuclease III